ncbi:MAG: CDP-diacylglycerol--serine O-phosphatidyltransferase [Desulforegulaceae bacterium]|jgi:CDP-diacylglycerol--serine O-phosphatidyltransferase|nr:CDP-diacylglycerol--serine O-phosphatidyltransferase [Desulforegulaceae bacterium]
MHKINRKIYILPNIFTAMNALCGFYSVVSSINGNFMAAATAVIVAMFFDIMDGRVARMTNTESRFGMEFDSLSDLVSFGVAPAILFYMWVFPHEGRVGWLTAFVFVICGALRLARFNVSDHSDSRFFTGLPIPAAAFICVTWFLFCNKTGFEGKFLEVISIILSYLTAFLMVSNVKYPCLKKMDKDQKIPFNILVAVILAIVLIASEPQIMLFITAFIYLLSGLVIFLRSIHAKDRNSVKSE